MKNILPTCHMKKMGDSGRLNDLPKNMQLVVGKPGSRLKSVWLQTVFGDPG